jgi:endogenous inhibitor of DNA gyrase (YacG/DUF329 family)
VPPTNRKCPSCGQTINVLRAPIFAGKNYCTSDCAIDAWEWSKEKAVAREVAARLAAEQFGKGTEPDADSAKGPNR